MMNVRKVATLVGTAWLMLGIPASGKSPLDMRVVPTMVLEPAFVTVRVTVEARPGNRLLEVVAETPDYRRSSQIPLDGARAPRVSMFEFRDLPTGVYEVTGTLADENGALASVVKTLVVAPARAQARRR